MDEVNGRRRSAGDGDKEGSVDEANDGGDIVYTWSYSGVFTTDDGTKYELSKEEVLAALGVGTL